MKEVDAFYDRFGEVQLRLFSNSRIVELSTGRSLGFLDGEKVYNYDGSHVGWLEKGILRDLNGDTVAFGLNPTDTPRPLLPFRQFRPFPAIVEIEPIRPIKEFARFKSLKSFGWSALSPVDLFGGQNG